MGSLWEDSLTHHEAEPQTVGGVACAQGLSRQDLGTHGVKVQTSSLWIELSLKQSIGTLRGRPVSNGKTLAKLMDIKKCRLCWSYSICLGMLPQAKGTTHKSVLPSSSRLRDVTGTHDMGQPQLQP